ncbi:MAG: LysE family translocator [Marinifilaceae bacterium]
MELNQILTFLSASVILSLMPGPDNIFVLTESVTKGQRNGIAISFGLSTGVLLHTLAAATGLSIIIQQSDFVFSLLKYLGAAYLFFLAFTTIKEGRPDVEFGPIGSSGKFKLFSMVKKGFFMNVLNPKVSLFFIAFLPQFVVTNDFQVTLQMIVLGVIFMIQSLVVFCGIACLSGRCSKYIRNDRFWKITKWGKVGVLSILGLLLLFSPK